MIGLASDQHPLSQSATMRSTYLVFLAALVISTLLLVLAPIQDAQALSASPIFRYARATEALKASSSKKDGISESVRKIKKAAEKKINDDDDSSDDAEEPSDYPAEDETGDTDKKSAEMEEIENLFKKFGPKWKRQLDKMKKWYNGNRRAVTSAPTKADKSTKAPYKASTKAPSKAPTKAPTKAATKAPLKKSTKAPPKGSKKAPSDEPSKLPDKVSQVINMYPSYKLGPEILPESYQPNPRFGRKKGKLRFDSLEADSLSELEGDSRSELEGDSRSELEGDSRSELEGDSRSELEGDSRSELEGDSRSELEGDSRSELEGDSRSELEGDSRSELEEGSRGAAAAAAAVDDE